MKECPICHTCFSDESEICSNDRSMLLDLIEGPPIINNKYRLEKKIGIGRVGIVFQATILETGQRVAIKVISPNLVVADSTLRERFFLLIGAFATLEHVNIVKVFDFGQAEPNILYFVMEYLPIPTLADILQQQKQLPLDLALNITSKVCEAIANANRNGVYHLDLKPSNIFVSKNNDAQQIVKVVDFAVVRLKVPSLISALSPMQKDYLLGKPYYSAPEQFSSEQIDPRSEVYAIGAILYHLLAGSPPFTGGSYPMLKMQHMGVTPASLREIRPEIPPTVESIIIKALDKRSTQRHSSVIALAVQLSAQLAKYKEFLLSQQNSTLPTLPTPPEPFYSSDPTPVPLYSSESTPVPIKNYTTTSLPDNTLPTLPEPPEPFYSNDPTPVPITTYSPIFPLNDTLASLPTPPEPFYSSDPTPIPTLEKQPSYMSTKMEETLGDFPPSPESGYFSKPTTTSSQKNSFSNIPKLEETLGAFPETVERFYSRDITPVPQTNTVYSETAKENPQISKPSGLTEPVYSVPSLVAPTLLIEEGNIVTRPLASESFYIGERFDEVIQKNIEEVQAFEHDDIDQVFELAGIGESAEKLSVSTFLTLSSVEQQASVKETYQLSPSAIIYLFIDQFVPTLLSGQRGRQMHNNFTTERERLAALLLVSALFSLSCRGVLEISVGSGAAQKKQIALSQKNEGFIVRAINLEEPALDILESKIIDALKQNSTIRFYNIFLHLAQTSVATSEREAICEIVADMIAEELQVNKFLRSKQRNRKLESGESAIQYELDKDLTPHKGQALAVQNWLQGLQQQASVELSGKAVQPFIYILKYYTDLFRHNSKELSKS